MKRKMIVRTAALLSIVLLSAGFDDLERPLASINEPVDVSPDYTYVDIFTESGRHKKVLVPEACLTPEEPYRADSGPPRLPPACANNYNLQRMVVRKKDLTKGRQISPPPAGPAAIAAKRYLEGKDPTLGGGLNQDTGGNVDSPKTSSSTSNQ